MSRPVVLLLHGPNLNLLGDREPEIYGTTMLADHVDRVRKLCDEAGFDLEDLQSNAEHELVEAVQGARRRVDAIIINAGALTHYGWSLHDALATYEGVVIEVHLSNPNAREAWRHTSVVAPVAKGTIMGFGGDGYDLAVEAVKRCLA
ncbi:MAG TPA: type II 3-dehydroquinate dehydratase [Acidimicrobiales bacterium]|nr:type II 3-dehydroquinate dehydratase [Acidimicrobiales bacterium]